MSHFYLNVFISPGRGEARASSAIKDPDTCVVDAQYKVGQNVPNRRLN